MTATQELADFITQRGYRLFERGEYGQAAEAFVSASNIFPKNGWILDGVTVALEKWKERVSTIPSWMPGMFARHSSRRFPNVDEQLEREFVALWDLDKP
jgi:hypothetical protein